MQSIVIGDFGDDVKKSIVILESFNEYYIDTDSIDTGTGAIVQALIKEDFEVEVVFYKNKDRDKIRKKLIKDKATALLVRVPTGKIKKVDNFFIFLDEIEKSGIRVYTDHKSMLSIDFKDILLKLKEKSYTTDDIKAYKSHKEFRKEFLKSIMHSRIRVLKRNYGSKGKDVWLIRLQDNGSIVADEAMDNKRVIYRDIPSFFKDFESKFGYRDKNEIYLKDKPEFIDMRYLSQIEDGEYRVLLVRDKIEHIIHKKPQKDSFSATLLSGAIYETKDRKEEKWETLKEIVTDVVKDISEHLDTLPILWSIDFIKDNKKYLLSEINSSCVEIDTVPQIADDMTKAICDDIK
jgi:glutathione synthase/RimK-type ligase-like ATP-grasp enzyme